MTIDTEWQEIMDIWHSIEDDTKYELANIWLDKEKHELKVMGAEIEDLAAKVIHIMKIIRDSKGDISEMDFHKKHLLSLIYHVQPTREWQREIQAELNDIAQEIKAVRQKAIAIEAAREKAAIIIRDNKARRLQQRTQQTSFQKDEGQYREIGNATILNPNELDKIYGDPSYVGFAKKARIGGIEEQYIAMRKPYMNALLQLDRIQTFPERFAQAKVIIKKFQEEFTNLNAQLAKFSASNPVYANPKTIIYNWFCYNFNQLTFLSREFVQDTPRLFLEENEQASDGIIGAIKNNGILVPHLCKAGDYFFIPETEAITKFTELLLKVVSEMMIILSSKESWKIERPLENICLPIFGEYSRCYFACGRRKGKKELSIDRVSESDRFYINEQAVEVLRQYPLHEARRMLESEIQKIRAKAEYRKMIVAAKIDVEASKHRLKHFSTGREAQHMLSGLNDRQKRKEELIARIRSLRTSLSGLLNETATISVNTGWSQRYGVKVGNEDIKTKVTETEREISRLEGEIREHDMSILQLKQARIVISRDKKISDKNAEKQNAAAKLESARKEIERLQQKKRGTDALCELLKNDKLGDQFAGRSLNVRDLLDKAQEVIEAHYSSISYMHPVTRASYDEYTSLQENLKAAEARFGTLG